MAKKKIQKTIQQINEKIRSGDVVVVTAEEMIDIVEQKGASVAAEQVDVNMVDGLPAVLAAVGHQTEASLAQVEASGHLPGDLCLHLFLLRIEPALPALNGVVMELDDCAFDTLAGVVAAPLLVAIVAPGFIGEDGRFDLATLMLRFTFPYILFISLTGLAGAMLNNFGKFAVPAFTPVLLNVVMISAAIWLEPLMPRPGLGLALGVFLAGLVQLFFQLPFLRGIGMLPRPRWGWRDSGVRKIGRLMLPAIFGSSVAQINLLIDTLIASFLAAGSITWLYYADRMMEFPLGVFGVALATVILPGLSEGDRVVTHGNDKITPGAKLDIIGIDDGTVDVATLLKKKKQA